MGNVVVLIELSGADLLAALENGVSPVEDAAGRFPQVSGMSYRYDASKPAGTLMAGAVIDYIARQGAIAPKIEGRITRLR